MWPFFYCLAATCRLLSAVKSDTQSGDMGANGERGQGSRGAALHKCSMMCFPGSWLLSSLINPPGGCSDRAAASHSVNLVTGALTGGARRPVIHGSVVRSAERARSRNYANASFL